MMPGLRARRGSGCRHSKKARISGAACFRISSGSTAQPSGATWISRRPCSTSSPRSRPSRGRLTRGTGIRRSTGRWHSAFDGALFRGTLNLYGAGFKAFAAFDGATLERGLQFDETDESAAKRTFGQELPGASAAARADGADFETKRIAKHFEASGRERELQIATGQALGLTEEEATEPWRLSAEARATFDAAFEPTAEAAKADIRKSGTAVSRSEIAAHVKTRREARLRELERGLRVLKLAMERSSNKSREQLFYRFELEARRAQKNLPPGEKFFSYLYDWTSDYGASMRLPFFWLFIIALLFTALYTAVSVPLSFTPGSVPDWPALADAANMSAARIFPFGAFDDVSKTWLADFERTHGAGWGLAMRIAASVQSALALALVFVFGLAVRRRFQIS